MVLSHHQHWMIITLQVPRAAYATFPNRQLSSSAGKSGENSVDVEGMSAQSPASPLYDRHYWPILHLAAGFFVLGKPLFKGAFSGKLVMISSPRSGALCIFRSVSWTGDMPCAVLYYPCKTRFLY